ncbi:g9097 [Coccomyxa viridis]|uniref:G9097 protein n=1 Tax=Coccomyxa viridis TaxID=1274662 RepID=A0ABP1G393_9CHLO
MDATTIEGIGNRVRHDHDMNEDGDPYVDLWGFVQILSFIGVRGSLFTETVGAGIIDDLCDDADQVSDIKKAVEKVVEKNEDDQEVYFWRSKDEIAAQCKCQCCEAGPWETRQDMWDHLRDSGHDAEWVAEKQQGILQDREGVEGCALCDRERFRSETARAAHFLTKSHLDAAERAERREQRRLGHRVQGRAHAARAAREERPAILRMEDYAVEGTEGNDRPQLHRVGRAFPKRQVPAPTPQSSELISEVPQGGALSPTALTPGAATPTTTCSDVPRQTAPVTDPQLGVQVPEAPPDGSTGHDASDAAPEVPKGPTLVIESAPGPSERVMIVAETAARSMDRAGEVDGCFDAPQDDFVTYLLSRFSEPQKRMFAESYGVYMREDMRNKHCIDLDLAFEWLGYRRKDAAVRLLMNIGLVEGQDFRKTDRNGAPLNCGPGECFDTAVKYYLTPRAFKKLLMRARTAQGDAATDYFLKIEDALLAYNTLKRTNAGVSQFDSSAKARRNGLRLRSVTDSINTHVSELYFGVPERTWAMLKPLNPRYSPSLLAVERAERTVIKFGMKRGDTDRTKQHCTAFQGFYLLDHVPTEHMAEVEDLLKAWLRNEGLLFEGLHENRRSRDTELTVVVTQADYARVVERTLVLIKQVDDKKRRLLGVGECTREEEARAEQEKARAEQEKAKADQEKSKAVQMTETTAQLAFQTRLAEIELVKLGLLRAQALSACQPRATCTSS